MNKFVKWLSLMLGVTLVTGMFSIFASPVASAGAAEPQSCVGANVEQGTGNCADVNKAESHSKSESSSKVVSVNGVKLNSNVTVLANIKANGTPRSQQNNCFRIPSAISAWTTYNASGSTGSHMKSYPAGYRFCNVNGVVRDPACHNKVDIGRPRSNPPTNAINGKVKLVKKLQWHVEAIAKADERVVVKAKAWCTGQGTYAYGEGNGLAYALAVGRASLKGSVLTRLMAQVKAKAAGDLAAQLGGQSIVKVRATVRSTAFTEAKAKASAIATCTNVQPPENPPTYIQFREFNDLEVNATSAHCVTVDFPAGYSGTVFWTAKFGSFAIPRKTAQDGVQVCSTYKAPSEVPASGTDQITVTATDTTTGKSVTQTTDPFLIKSSAPPPL